MTWIIGVAAALIVYVVANFLLPGFEKQEHAARIARALSSRMQGKSSEAAAVRLNVFQRTIDFVIGEEFRQKYNDLDRKEGFEYYLFKMFLISLLMAGALVVYYYLTKAMFFLALAPMALILTMWASLDQVNKLVKKREDMILNDLPLLFERMEVALEVGRPLKDIWFEVSKRSRPPLAKLLKRLITNSAFGEREALQQFADNIRHPTVYSLVSVVNVIRERGFEEAESSLKAMQLDMRNLRRLRQQEKNRSKPALLNVFLIIGFACDLVFLFMMFGKLFNLINTL